ncbi:MAG: VWA domain-containing protein [Planctomycetota bacterium]|nr:MAG: VWA domain-containing protein [Planctomycetota bacterium]
MKIAASISWGALGVSLVSHAVLIGVCAAIVWVAPSVHPLDSGLRISTEVAEPVEILSTTLVQAEWNPDRGGGTVSSAAPSMVVDSSELPQPSVATFEGVSLGTGEALNYTELIGELGNGTGEGAGNGAGVGDGSEEGFFGLDLVGEKFVFVVDASRSMNYPYPGEAKNRLGRVKIELLHAVGQMTAEQQFFVIFFNTEPIPMPAPGLMKANPSVVRSLMQWVFQTKATGQTDPERALLMALQLNPDRIYFLTDGDFSYRSVRAVREANHRLIPIHTIGFGGREGEQNLQEIATDSRGRYQFIPEPPGSGTPEKTAAARP